MAWRIDESVIRGEIDNRTRGRITGRIWIAGRSEPLELELTGNAWRDLAGRKLEFVNPSPTHNPPDGLTTRQTGVIGDCTASRKVKVPDVSKKERIELYKQKQPFPWHWSNSLYLEWYSNTNGRIVIESASFQLTMGPESAWDMSVSEEEAQRSANAEAMEVFMSRLGDLAAIEPEDTATARGSERDESWMSQKPLTEAEAEKMQEDSDRLVDRIQERMAGEGEDADLGKILDEELERRARERGEKPLTPDEEARRAEWIEEMNRAAADAVENPDPELEAELESKHPLAEQALKLTLRVMNEPEEHGWIGSDADEDHPLVDLASASSNACAKLAGALNGYTWPQPVDLCAGTIVRLKRARRYLDEARLAADACVQRKLTDAAWIADVQRELSTMAHECDALINELRTKLERGFD